MNDKRGYSPEVRERVIRMVREQLDQFNSEWAAIRSIAEKFGCKTEVIHQQGPWREASPVECATLTWVDWFNQRRLLGSIGEVPPAELEAAYY